MTPHRDPPHDAVARVASCLPRRDASPPPTSDCTVEACHAGDDAPDDARRRWLRAAAAAAMPLGAMLPVTRSHAQAPSADAVRPGRPWRFPRDHGAHPGARIEWWYATGWLHAPGPPTPPRHGFQLTFFRQRTPWFAMPRDALGGPHAARQLLFAHAAWTDLASGRHRHAQRVARFADDATFAPRASAHAARDDADLRVAAWSLRRDAQGSWHARLPAPDAGFALDLVLTPTQPVLLQGDAGFSRKGPDADHASHYLTLPQLDVRATLRSTAGGAASTWQGRGWLDHEWSDALLPPGAVGWDWCGINLLDGGALTAFRLRDAAGHPVHAGGSHRTAVAPDASGVAAAARPFEPAQVQWTPQAWWRSPSTGARYPVQWRLVTPLGGATLRALVDAQELDARATTGTAYWEGLAELRADDGRLLGLGYLEMTGYGGALRLG